MEKPKILVVDDEEIIRQLLDRTLEEKGYVVEAVEDGDTALEKIKGNAFNLLIADLKMPKVNGMEVLRELKKVNPYVEVIVITGYPTIESAVEAIKIGAFDFICKPFDIQIILSTIERSLEKQKFNLSHFRLSELMTLFEVSKIMTATTDLDVLLARVLDSALEITQAKRGSLLLVDDKTKELRIKVARGLNQEIIDNTRIKIGEGISGRIAQDGAPVLVNNIEEDCRFKRKNNPQYETKSFLGVPLTGVSIYYKRNFLGLINISDKISGDNFTEREQTLLSILAGETAVAIENAKLYSQLQNKIEALKQNVKKLNETQNQLIQTEKMAAVGQLAFGIAHEIRNPLGTILGGVEFLGNKLSNKKDEIIKKSLKKIEQSIDRANNIIVELLKFSKASQLELQPVDVCKTIDAVVSLIKNQAYLKNVQIKRNYIEKDFQVQADPTMLQQTFFNLCINAIEAMPKGGKLFIYVYWQAKEQASRKIVIEIIDTGKGIPKDKLSKIFEPFFTTKAPGEGTGLGLSIVHLILQRHNATIDVESEVGKGTKFIIRLPVTKNIQCI